MKIDIAIIGAGGLTGREILKILRHHPHLNPKIITSDTYTGKKLNEIFYEFGESELIFSNNDVSLPESIPVFYVLQMSFQLLKLKNY